MIVFYQLGDDGEAETVKISEQEAIRCQRAAASIKGYEYESDELALEDFMIVHWAVQENSELK